MNTPRIAYALCALIFVSCPAAGQKARAPKERAKDSARGGRQGKVAVFVLDGQIHELRGAGAALKRHPLILPKLLRRLRLARQDPKVSQVLVIVRNLRAGWGQLADLRYSLTRLRAAGKHVVVYLQSPTNGTYYLATAADEIVVPPGATFWTVGMNLEVLFLKGLLDKLGVEAQFVKMGRYKGAAEPLTRTSMSKDLRVSLEAVLDGIFTHYIKTLAQARGLPQDQVRRLVAQAPFGSERAKALKLVDRVSHLEDIIQQLGGRQNCLFGYGIEKKKPSLADLLQLLQGHKMTTKTEEPHVALVVAKGPVLLGEGSDDLFSFQDVIASDRLVRTLRKLEKNPAVRAVVLRIDSPGGSALASEIIWNAVHRLDRRKPVVVSMGNVAASGGYYIASAARRIFAEPGTLTGSIGVLGGKLVLQGLFQKIGVSVEAIHRGPHARILSAAVPFSDEEKQALTQLMSETYALFVARVAQGRHLSKAAVSKVAEGRVWVGLDALGLRLVDKIGGLEQAVESARQLGGLPKDAPTLLYPPPKNFLQILAEQLGDTSPQVRAGLPGPWHSALRLLGGALEFLDERDLTPLVGLAAALQREKVALMAPWTIRIR